MREPRTVWMVGPSLPDPVEGILALVGGELSFAPLHGEGFRLSPGQIQGVRRLLASPALKIRYRDDTGPKEAFFFFAKPAPLPEGPKVLSAKNLQRTSQAMILREQSKQMKAEIRGWVEWIRGLAGWRGER